MILVDANVLIFAYSPRAPEHDRCRRWFEHALSGPELVRFAWVTIWAFARITTNPRVFEHPLTIDEAVHAAASWLDQPTTGILDPGERHWTLLGDLARRGQATGALVMDAVLAALAIEHGATLYTTDRDFSRFPGLRWVNPLLEP